MGRTTTWTTVRPVRPGFLRVEQCCCLSPFLSKRFRRPNLFDCSIFKMQPLNTYRLMVAVSIRASIVTPHERGDVDTSYEGPFYLRFRSKNEISSAHCALFCGRECQFSCSMISLASNILASCILNLGRTLVSFSPIKCSDGNDTCVVDKLPT